MMDCGEGGGRAGQEGYLLVLYSRDVRASDLCLGGYVVVQAASLQVDFDKKRILR